MRQCTRGVAHHALVGCMVALILAYFGWTTGSSFSEPLEIGPKGWRETDHFNLLNHGFLRDRLDLGDAPPDLINAPNPYDPETRKGVKVLHDASYYRGKYYIYFGPVPVVTLLMPFTAITGRDLPLPYGVLIFVSFGFLALVATFLFIRRRYFPNAGAWTTVSSLLALGAGSMLVALLRRPHIWEFPTAAGFAFFAVTLYCLVRAVHGRAWAWTLAGGFTLGLATGSRPIYIVGAPLFLVPVLLRHRDYGWRGVLGAAMGCAPAIAALLTYNYARFENPFEFGQKYQLSSIIEGEARHFSLTYFPFNFQLYFLAALRWMTTFPFHLGVALPPNPAGHAGHEYVIGIVPNLPFSLFAGMFIAWLLGFRRLEPSSGNKAITGWCVLLAAVLPGIPVLFYFGVCIRYMTDFLPSLMLLACLGLLECESRSTTRVTARLVRGAGSVLAVFNSFAAAVSVVMIYLPTDEIPHDYRPMARVLNYPTYWWHSRDNPGGAPMEVTFSLREQRPAGQEPLLVLRRGVRETATIDIEYLADQHVRFIYRESHFSRSSLSFAAPAGAKHTFRVHAGGSYDEFDGQRFRLRAEFNGRLAWDIPAVSLNAFPSKLSLAPPGRFSGEVHSSRAIGDRLLAATAVRGARVRVTITPAMIGRSFPLAASGRQGAGDLLILRVLPNDRIVFAYDHWGDALRLSREISAPVGSSPTLEFWLPVTSRDLVVAVDEKLVWREAVPVFPIRPSTYYLGSNVIGGTTCEAVLENGIVEDTQVPPRVF